MKQERDRTTESGSVVDPSYSEGEYFTDPQRHRADAAFKAEQFLSLFLRIFKPNTLQIQSFVDVGCGAGEIIKKIADSLRTQGFNSATFKAYDVSPHVLNIKKNGVEYIHGDFCEGDGSADVVTLFDVFEHVPDPICFLKKIAGRSRVVAMHIPLDDTWNYALRNRFRKKLTDPGHLIFLNTASALNLLAYAGLRVVDYQYTFSFMAPSGHKTLLQKIIFPLRYLLARISPWVLSRILGGASLMVLAMTPGALEEGAANTAETNRSRTQ